MDAGKTPADQLLPTDLRTLDGVEGTVVGIVYNEEMLLKTSQGYLVAYFGPEFQHLGIGRGDTVQVWGEMDPRSVLKSTYKASKIEMVKREENRPEPIGIKTIAEVQGMRFTDRVVATFGRIEEFTGTRMRLTNAGSSIWVDLGTNVIRENLAYAVGMDLIVIGELKVKAMDKEISAIVLRGLDHFRKPGEPTEAQDIATILKDQPKGKVVRANGRIALYLGNQKANVLYQGENVLIVYLSDKYLSMDLPAGNEVEVIGTFDTETHNEREYGVLRDARIDPVASIRALQKIEDAKSKQ